MNNLVALDAIHSGSNTNHSGDNSNEGSSIAQTETDAETDVARWKRLYAGNGIETDGLHVTQRNFSSIIHHQSSIFNSSQFVLCNLLCLK